MKKKFSTKLIFHKTTIASLNLQTQEKIRAGVIVLYTKTAYPTCAVGITCGETYCPWTYCGSIDACIC